MSLPNPDSLSKKLTGRLASLRMAGLCVDLTELRGGEVIHTGFGGGPEFWLLDQGLDPGRTSPDMRRLVVPGARLILQDGKPVEDAKPIAARGGKVTMNIPQV